MFHLAATSVRRLRRYLAQHDGRAVTFPFGPVLFTHPKQPQHRCRLTTIAETTMKKDDGLFQSRTRQMKNYMAWSFLFGLSWIQPLYIYCFCFACCLQRSTEATCQVKTDRGQDMVMATGPFPKGIYYDQIKDRLTCESPGSCRKYNITGCATVRCEEERSCYGADFSHINYLRCRGSNSCARVTVTDTEMVYCGVLQTSPSQKFRSSCEKAKISIRNNFLNCVGPGSCYAPWSEDRMVVDAGSQATVSCGSSSVNHRACGNMIIEVSHGDRACYATDWYQTCALYCDGNWNCDKSAIEFRVVNHNNVSGN